MHCSPCTESLQPFYNVCMSAGILPATVVDLFSSVPTLGNERMPLTNPKRVASWAFSSHGPLGRWSGQVFGWPPLGLSGLCQAVCTNNFHPQRHGATWHAASGSRVQNRRLHWTPPSLAISNRVRALVLLVVKHAGLGRVNACELLSITA